MCMFLKIRSRSKGSIIFSKGFVSHQKVKNHCCKVVKNEVSVYSIIYYLWKKTSIWLTLWCSHFHIIVKQLYDQFNWKFERYHCKIQLFLLGLNIHTYSKTSNIGEFNKLKIINHWVRRSSFTQEYIRVQTHHLANRRVPS